MGGRWSSNTRALCGPPSSHGASSLCSSDQLTGASGSHPQGKLLWRFEIFARYHLFFLSCFLNVFLHVCVLLWAAQKASGGKVASRADQQQHWAAQVSPGSRPQAAARVQAGESRHPGDDRLHPERAAEAAPDFGHCSCGWCPPCPGGGTRPLQWGHAEETEFRDRPVSCELLSPDLQPPVEAMVDAWVEGWECVSTPALAAFLPIGQILHTELAKKI